MKEYSPRKFLPLIAVFSFVIVLSAVSTILFNLSIPMEAGMSLMAAFFLTFGSFKVYNLEGFQEAFESYDPLAERFNIYSKIYPFLEIGLGLSYVLILIYSIPSLQIAVFISTIVLMSLNGAGVLEALYNEKELHCACLGNVFDVPLTGLTLFEDSLMAIMALWMLFAII